MARFRFKLTGFFLLEASDGNQIRPNGQKPAAILAYLAFNRGKEVTRDRLIDLFWSDRGQKQGQDSLRQALYAIRSSLSDYAPGMIQTSRLSVSLDQKGIEYDLWHSDGSINEKKHDIFLEDLDNVSPVFDDWLLITRREIRQRQVFRAERLLAGLDVKLDAEETLSLTQTILKLDPTNEPAARAAIEIHAARDEIGHASRVFDELRRRLQADELDISRRTIDLFYRAKSTRTRGTANAPQTPSNQLARAARSETDLPLVEVITVADPATREARCDDVDEIFNRLVSRMVQMPELRVRAGGSTNEPENRDFRLVLTHTVRNLISRTELQLLSKDGEAIWTSRVLLSQNATEEQIEAQVDALITMMLPALEQYIYQGIKGSPATAYENYLFARRQYIAASGDDYIDRVLKYLHRAVELDSEFLPAIEQLIMHYNTGSFMSWPGTDHSKPREKAYQLAQHLLFLNSQYPNAHVRMGWCLLWRRSYQSAERSFQRAMELKPYDPVLLNVLGTALVYLGRLDLGERYYKMAQDRLVHDMDFMRTDYGELFYLKGEFDTALSWIETPEIRTPYRTLFWRIPTYAQLGRLVEARQDVHDMIADLRRRWRGPKQFSAEAALQWMCDMKPYRRPRDRDLLVDGFNKAGLAITARNFPSI